jgi:hypothetical protein
MLSPLKKAVMENVQPASRSLPVARNQYLVAMTSRDLTVVAWVVTVLISTVPDIAFDELGRGVPAWLPGTKIGLLVVMGLAAIIWQPLRPLRNFFVVMIAFFGLTELRPRLDFTLPALQGLFGNTAFDGRMQAEQVGKLAVALVMIALLFVLGYRRQRFFLARGDLHAPIEPVPWLGFPKPDPWPRFGLQWGFYLAAALAVFQYIALRPTLDQLVQVIPVLPSILFYAALNAFNEEMTYRAPMLTTLEPAGGSKQALWMAAYFFGIAHYFGTPGGVLGGLLSIFMGWILGKGMVETRGLFWTWWIHFLADIAIFTFMTAALLA